jgi:hypothetical protein
MVHYKSNTIIPLSLLREHPQNYKRHTEQQIEQLMKALRRFGQIRSIVTKATSDGTYTIVAGHGIVKAAKKLGFTELRSDILPANFSEEETRAYIIADNRLQDESNLDEELLTALLLEQKEAMQDLTSLGSNDAELNILLEKYNEDELRKLTEETTSILQISPIQPAVVQNESQHFAPVQLEVKIDDNPFIQTSFEPIHPVLLQKQEISQDTYKERIYTPNVTTPKIIEQPLPRSSIPEEEYSQELVLLFKREEYTWIMARLKQIRRATQGLETNTDIIIHLLRSYILTQGLPDVEIDDPFVTRMLHE